MNRALLHRVLCFAWLVALLVSITACQNMQEKNSSSSLASLHATLAPMPSPTATNLPPPPPPVKPRTSSVTPSVNAPATIQSTASNATPTVTISIQVRVTVYKLNVRAGPDTSFAKVTQVLDGDVLTALGRNSDNTWIFVKTPDGKKGWVAAKFTDIGNKITKLPRQ